MCFHHAAGSQPTRSMFKQDREFCAFTLLQFMVLTVFLKVGTNRKADSSIKHWSLSFPQPGQEMFHTPRKTSFFFFFFFPCIILTLMSRKQRISSWHYPLPLKFSLMVACSAVDLTSLSTLCPKFPIPKMNQCSLSPVTASCWDVGTQNREGCLPQRWRVYWVQ